MCIFCQDIEKVVAIDMYSNKRWAKSIGINIVLPMGTYYQFYFILFDNYSAVMCLRKESLLSVEVTDVEKVPENKYL